MRIDFTGKLSDEKEIRAGFIGCGSHSFRNIYPTFQYAHVELVATCDLSLDKAKAFAKKFGATNAYSDYKEMLTHESLDAVFIVTSYDNAGRPVYSEIATDCINAGCNVWIEKPPAVTSAELERLQEVAKTKGKIVGVGLKKMFFPANEKAKELSDSAEFGIISMVNLQYPQFVPTKEDLERYYFGKEYVIESISFLDHLCHPASLMVYLLGMPIELYYDRNQFGAGVAIFKFESGAIANMSFTNGSSMNGGMERTTIISNSGKHIVVDNNIKLSYHQTPPNIGYGDTPSFYLGTPGETSSVWEPEFSLGQLYNKGLFLLGYFNEINEFASAIIQDRPLSKGHLEHAKQVTQIFEKFLEGPGKVIHF